MLYLTRPWWRWHSPISSSNGSRTPSMLLHSSFSRTTRPSGPGKRRETSWMDRTGAMWTCGSRLKDFNPTEVPDQSGGCPSRRRRIPVWEPVRTGTRRYDNCLNISGLEETIDDGRANDGYAILITNDLLHCNLPTKPDTNDSNLVIHGGREIIGTLAWNPRAGAGTAQGRSHLIQVKSMERRGECRVKQM